MANPSLAEYIAQSQRGLYQSVFGPGFMKKAGAGIGTPFTVDTATGIFNTTYGRKVWQALNNQTRFFNAIPRVVWGNTAGWRVRSDRGSDRSRPILETGNLPTVDISQIETISSLPRIVATTFGASVKSVFTAQLEGGIGDVLALENENAQLDHMKEVNFELLSLAAARASGGSGTTVETSSKAIADNFHMGDEVARYDASGSAFDLGTGVTIGGSGSTAHTSAGIITVDTSSPAWAAGDIAYVLSRAGFTSLDDLVAEDAAAVGGGSSRVRAFDLTHGGRTAGDWNAGAFVSHNAGVARDLSLNLIDTCIQKIRENGGEPKLILMGHDQYFKLERLLNSQQRYMGQEEYQVGIGSERTFPGTRTGLVLATYMGIPILPDADVPKSHSSSSGVLGSNVYVLDTDYLELAIAQPTQYVENRDYFAANSLVVRGLLYTLGEMRCKNFFVQAKIADLSA
jgi:hypothetical protein